MSISRKLFYDTILNNIPSNVKLPRRGQIYVGFRCTQQCGFCYYKSKCADSFFPLSKIQAQIDFEYDYGIREFEITGGAASLYQDLRSVCEYIKQKPEPTKIAIITNGGLYQSDIWDLIDEVLVSYHLEKNPVSYNKQIFPLGSTYYKVKQTVEKAHANNIMLRTNTVIGTFNLDNLDNIVNDLIEFNPAIINFLPVNLFDEAYTLCDYIDYSILKPKLKNVIDKIKTNLRSAQVFIRYIPFCNMEGYESHIVGQLQHIFDPFDWNRELNGTEILKMIETYDESLAKLGQYGSTSISAALDIADSLYEKSKKCFTCKYYLLCDGVEKTPNSTLLNQIVPSPGRWVKNILKYFSRVET